jgi:hypothetical protein
MTTPITYETIVAGREERKLAHEKRKQEIESIHAMLDSEPMRWYTTGGMENPYEDEYDEISYQPPTPIAEIKVYRRRDGISPQIRLGGTRSLDRIGQIVDDKNIFETLDDAQEAYLQRREAYAIYRLKEGLECVDSPIVKALIETAIERLK